MKKNLLVSLLLAMALPCFAGSFTDSRDGQTYNMVKIGDQVWMAQNLNYKTGKSWCYDNKDANCQKYGRLYTWPTAVGKSEQQCGLGENCNLRGQVRGVCPEGWHLPSKEEFETLVKVAGGREDPEGEGQWKDAGKPLRSKKGWGDDGDGSNALGFTALLAGYYYISFDAFVGEGKYTSFWSSTEYNKFSVYFLDLFYDSEYACVLSNGKYYGYYVRCLKND